MKCRDFHGTVEMRVNEIKYIPLILAHYLAQIQHD